MEPVKLDYPIFDADEHYYEVDDTFTRFGDEKVRKHVRWVQEGKRRHLMFGNRLSTGVPNPTFDPIAKPGAFHDRLKKSLRGLIRLPTRRRFVVFKFTLL